MTDARFVDHLQLLPLPSRDGARQPDGDHRPGGLGLRTLADRLGVLVAVSAVGLAAVHSAMMFVAALLVLCLLVQRAVPAPREFLRRDLPRLGLLGVGAAVIAVPYLIGASTMAGRTSAYNWAAVTTPSRAFGDAVLFGHEAEAPQYLLAASQIFGLSDEETAVVSNIARYHRRGMPRKSHLPYMELDWQDRLRVNKLGAILRIANALDAEHLQKVQELRLHRAERTWVLELDGTGDITMEQLAATARSDMLTEVFGHELIVRAAGVVS